MRMGIAGAGKIVRTLFQFIHDVEGIELEAIASTPRSIEKVKAMAEQQGIKKYYSCYDELVADKDIEVMYIASPNHLHYAMCKQALEAGKHVICEKPFTSRVEELEELNRIAKSNGLILLEAISTQYLPNVLKIKEMLKETGDVKIVIANFSKYSSRYDAFKSGEILPAFDYTKCGGALMDINIYNIQLMVALFGKPLKVEYSANIERNIDTSGILTLDYGTFKAVLIGAKDCSAPISTNIQGDKGCINITTPASLLKWFTILKNDGTEETINLQGTTHRMYFEFVEFVKIITTKDYERASEMMDKSLTAMWILTEARKSGGIHFPMDDKYESIG